MAESKKEEPKEISQKEYLENFSEVLDTAAEYIAQLSKKERLEEELKKVNSRIKELESSSSLVGNLKGVLKKAAHRLKEEEESPEKEKPPKRKIAETKSKEKSPKTTPSERREKSATKRLEKRMADLKERSTPKPPEGLIRTTADRMETERKGVPNPEHEVINKN